MVTSNKHFHWPARFGIDLNTRADYVKSRIIMSRTAQKKSLISRIVDTPESRQTRSGLRHTRLAELSNFREGYATSPDGTRIWYRSYGKGVPIIFCNGLGCSVFYWDHIYTYFKKKHRVVLFDWRAHGRSEKPQDPEHMTVSHLIQDLRAVMDELKIRKAVLVGHSMGTQLIYDFFSHYKSRVLGLISCFGTFGKPLDTFYNTSLTKHVFELIYFFNTNFPRLAKTVGRMMGANPLWFQMGSALKMMNPGLVDKRILKEYMDHITSLDPVLLAKLTRSLQGHDTEPVLKTINVPTMIIAAEEDTFTPVWVSKKKHHLIPNSELMIIKKASHVALVEQPELINLRIEKFLKERGIVRAEERPVQAAG